MATRKIFPVLALFVAIFSTSSPAHQDLDRTVLPIPEPKYPPYTELDVRDTQPPPRFEVTPPKDAPDVLIILIDDLGFGATSVFGGPIPTETLPEPVSESSDLIAEG